MVFQKNWALNFIGNWWSLCYVWRSLVFQIFGNSHLVFKNAVGGSGSRNYTPVSLLYVVGKIFAKFVKNRLVDTVKNYLFFRFPLWMYFFLIYACLSIAEHWIFVADRTARGFNMVGATWAIQHDISNACDSVWHTGPPHK